MLLWHIFAKPDRWIARGGRGGSALISSAMPVSAVLLNYHAPCLPVVSGHHHLESALAPSKCGDAETGDQSSILASPVIRQQH